VLQVHISTLYRAPDLNTTTNHAALTLSRASWLRLLKDMFIDFNPMTLVDRITLSSVHRRLSSVHITEGNSITPYTGILLNYTLIYEHNKIFDIETIVHTNNGTLKEDYFNVKELNAIFVRNSSKVPFYSGTLKLLSVTSQFKDVKIKELKPTDKGNDNKSRFFLRKKRDERKLTVSIFFQD